MNEILEAIKNRRSVRKFKLTPVDDEKLKTVLTAGQWAPSFMNTQPWKFIVIRRSETKRKLIDALHLPFLGVDFKGDLPYKDLLEVPVMIVICADTKRDRIHYIEDSACAAENIALAAHAIGLGSYWVGVFNSNFVEDAVKKVLKVPETYRAVALLPLGVPAEAPVPRRDDLENMVYYEEFGGKSS
ncbi:MAG TPA: nitroreductase family protein [Candidatus Bathyarchaeia archaeon]|nr:nitroreductase family protein [Candidatus Bathyarchaeia archaeon]